MSENRVCKALGIEKPVIQGPMAYAATAPLVAAVSNAGGLGVLGIAFAPREFVKEQIALTRKLTDKPFGINVMLAQSVLDELNDLILEEKPPVCYCDVLLGLSEEMCRTYFKPWQEVGIKVVVKASSVYDAIAAEKGGADVVVVKGWEGGGHVTYEATTVLVPQARDAISIPLVGSGGIADGRGMAAAIALGAEGIEMGTVFLCAEEALIPDSVKQAVVDAQDMDNVITGACTGAGCRQLSNALSDKLIEIECENVREDAAKIIQDVSTGSLRAAMLEGDVDERGAVMAGQIAPLVKSVRPAKEIIDSIIEESKKVIEAMTKFTY